MIILEKIINIFFNLSTFWDRVYVSQFGHRQLTYSIRSLTEHEADECRRHLWKLLVCCALWCPQLPKEQCLQRRDTTAFLLFCETFALLWGFCCVVSHSPPFSFHWCLTQTLFCLKEVPWGLSLSGLLSLPLVGTLPGRKVSLFHCVPTSPQCGLIYAIFLVTLLMADLVSFLGFRVT